VGVISQAGKGLGKLLHNPDHGLGIGQVYADADNPLNALGLSARDNPCRVSNKGLQLEVGMGIDQI
jgi:hypothetical protein